MEEQMIACYRKAKDIFTRFSRNAKILSLKPNQCNIYDIANHGLQLNAVAGHQYLR